MDNGDHEDNEYYGGDAYTGIQQAAAQTANNIQTLTENITTIGGYILLLTGMTFAAIGWYELQIISEKEKNQEDNFPENSAEPQKKDASSEEAL